MANSRGLPSVAEHALAIKSLADAAALHAHLIDKLEHADLEPDPRLRAELLTFVVAGGGFAGVETLAELNDFVRDAGRYYPRVRPTDIRVFLVHSADRILPEVSAPLSQYALSRLRQSGAEVLLQTRVRVCTPRSVSLSSGETITCRTFVWAAGTAPSPLLAASDLPLHPSGRIAVLPTLRTVCQPDVWAVGDSAAVPDASAGQLCPATAQVALLQARVLAGNLAAVIRQRGAARAFRYRSLGMLAGLGKRSAVAQILGLRFSGFFAWWLWRTVYLLKMPRFERKLRIALDWNLAVDPASHEPLVDERLAEGLQSQGTELLDRLVAVEGYHGLENVPHGDKFLRRLAVAHIVAGREIQIGRGQLDDCQFTKRDGLRELTAIGEPFGNQAVVFLAALRRVPGAQIKVAAA